MELFLIRQFECISRNFLRLCGVSSSVEPRMKSLSSGFHAAADVAITTALSAVGVAIFYPIYVATVVAKVPLKAFNRWRGRDASLCSSMPCRKANPRAASAQSQGETIVH
jgi:hypothetical protein